MFRRSADVEETLGAVFSPGVIRHNRILMAAFCALAILGLFYALTT